MSVKLNNTLMFSLVTGDIYTIEKDELSNMDEYQIPLLKKPSSSCKKCYGRMYEGYDILSHTYKPCRKCLAKCIDYESLASKYKKANPPKND